MFYTSHLSLNPLEIWCLALRSTEIAVSHSSYLNHRESHPDYYQDQLILPPSTYQIYAFHLCCNSMDLGHYFLSF